MSAEVQRLAALFAQSTMTLSHQMSVQLKATALQTRHRHLLHLFAVADADVRTYEDQTTDSNFSNAQHKELVNARSAIQMELDDVLEKLTDMVGDCDAQVEDDMQQLQDHLLELSR